METVRVPRKIISLTKQKQDLNNFKIKVYYSAGILCQGTHNVVVVVVFANVVVVVVAFADAVVVVAFADVVVVVVAFADAVVVVVVVVFAFSVRRNGNVFARHRGDSQVLVEWGNSSIS